ncbi:MAG: GntR family transcriptional regulator, partial [Nitrospiraceae bacterium]
AELAYDAIAERIASGEYGAHERITEARIVEEFDVSRGAAREALSKLAADGLVALEIYKGAIVRALSRKDMADFLEVRGVFEAFAAQRSAERINEPGAREAIHAVLQECAELESNPSSDAMVKNDTSFHATIMDMSGNSILAAEWRRLRRSRYRIRFLKSLTEKEIKESVAQHREVLHAILDGDSDLAGALASKHVRMTNSRIQRLPNDKFDQLFNPPGRKAQLNIEPTATGSSARRRKKSVKK